jgi:hypothetical protein
MFALPSTQALKALNLTLIKTTTLIDYGRPRWHKSGPACLSGAKIITPALSAGLARNTVLTTREDVMTGLRFGIVSESVLQGRAWLDYARQIEDAGIGALLIRDHFSAGAFGPQLAPFTALASAAAVTTRLRVGTLVLSNDFRHPAIVAHEAASLHLVSEGRFELGLGAGWYQPEYDAAGIGFDPAGQRIGRLEESLGIIRALLPAAFDAKIAVLREAAGDRFPGLELNAFGTFILTDRRRASTDELIRERGWSGLDAETVWQMPTIFIGSAAQIRDDLRARRDRFGLSYLVAAESALPELTEIISGL